MLYLVYFAILPFLTLFCPLYCRQLRYFFFSVFLSQQDVLQHFAYGVLSLLNEKKAGCWSNSKFYFKYYMLITASVMLHVSKILDTGVTYLCIALYQCDVYNARSSPHNFMSLSPPSNILSLTLWRAISSWTFPKYFPCTHILKYGSMELKNNQFLHKSTFPPFFFSTKNDCATSIAQELC